ncbi:anaerobic ribonucleoside-triphosphate reductase activating protein [Candidatus Uhrbacteria bacterium]|nr:anaerobic ribonucleoside-triphosphate reductase activating protein [Candidatus Uhrbacteria bacterium]
MIVAGIQPVSLIDYPEKPCTVLFTQGCVFRCSYCHNPDLIPLESASPKNIEETFEFLKNRKAVVDAVCITGGEPTIHTGLSEFIKRLKKEGFFVKLDTNGIHPDVTQKLITDKLVDYIAMDVKAPWHKYLDVIKKGGRAAIDSCKKTFGVIQDSGIAHEFRTTVFPGVHTREDFFEIAENLIQGEQYFIQKTSFKKTLEPLDDADILDVDSLVKEMRNVFPYINIASR